MDFMHLCIPLIYISADAKAEKTSSAEAAKAKSCHPKNLLHRTFEKFDGIEANLKKLVDEGGLGEAGVTDQDALTATAKWLSSTQWQWNATFTAAEFMEYEEHQFAVMTLRFDRYNNLRGSGFWDMLALCTGSTEDDGEWKITCADTTDNDIKIFRCLDETTMVMESLESLVPMETASSDQSRRKLPGKTSSPKGMALLLQDHGNERFIPQPELN